MDKDEVCQGGDGKKEYPQNFYRHDPDKEIIFFDLPKWKFKIHSVLCNQKTSVKKWICKIYDGSDHLIWVDKILGLFHCIVQDNDGKIYLRWTTGEHTSETHWTQ